ISGNLDLHAATRTFTLASGTAPSGVDLDIEATISGGGAGITKAGAGTLRLGGANTFTAAVDVQVGVVIVTSNTALGAHDATVESGAALDLSGGITVANTLSIVGTGVTS